MIQHDIAWHDPATTLAALEPRVAAAAHRTPDAAVSSLVVLTEMFATGFSMQSGVISEPVGGPIERWLVTQATRHDTWIVGSIAQRDGDELPVNVAVLAAPDGRTFRYEKMHPFTYAGEHESYRAGNQPLTVDIDGLRTSIFICYDLRFADDFWALAENTDCYIVVANWPQARRDHWRDLLRARAIENQAYVVGANRVGAAGAGADLWHSGDSTIIDPLGQTLAEAAYVETTLTARLDSATVLDVRARLPFLVDRRPG